MRCAYVCRELCAPLVEGYAPRSPLYRARLVVPSFYTVVPYGFRSRDEVAAQLYDAFPEVICRRTDNNKRSLPEGKLRFRMRAVRKWCAVRKMSCGRLVNE